MMESATPQVSLVIVTYNSVRHIRECLHSIKTTCAEIPHEVCVVDNHSQDGSAELVRRLFPEVRLICNPENRGLSVALNQGFRASQGNCLLWLNPDTELLPGTLATLIDSLEAMPGAGAVGGRLLNTDRSLQQSFGWDIGLVTEFTQKLFFNGWERWRNPIAGFLLAQLHRREREVDWLKGACVLLRRQALFDAELMDENFFLYMEDADLCHRLRHLGWKVRYTPRAETLHHGGASVDSAPERAALEFRRSQLHYYRKHVGAVECRLLSIYLQCKMMWGLAACELRRLLGWGTIEESRVRKKLLKDVLALLRQNR